MNLLVLLAGIADPKWPLPAPPCDAAALAAHRARYPLLSPFDEAALEVALKLRDAAPDTTRVKVLIAAHGAADPLLRHVAGLRLDAVEGFDLAAWPAWQSGALAAALAARLRAAPPDLVLVGREFGDLDDGTLPAQLAEALGWPFAALTLGAQAGAPGTVQLTRQQGAGQERLVQPLPAVAAVTNHASNRLRHPLLKNVMAARKLGFDCSPLPKSDTPAALSLRAMGPAPSPARGPDCRMLAGDTAAQAAQLAALLRTLAVPAAGARA